MIWLLRHGDALEGEDDAARQLTERGRTEASNAAAALAALGVTLETCLSSPRARALATARIACEGTGVEPESVDALSGGDFDPLELATGRGEVLIVAHEPDLSRAINAVTGARVEMKKGSLAAIEDGALRALLRPADLVEITRAP